MKNVLVACEYSGTVRDAFRRAGHNAWSCDLLPSEGELKWNHYHFLGDVCRLLGGTPDSPGMFYDPLGGAIPEQSRRVRGMGTTSAYPSNLTEGRVASEAMRFRWLRARGYLPTDSYGSSNMDYPSLSPQHCLPTHWDIVIAHPECTHLAVSGSRHFESKRLSGVQAEAIEFFLYFTRLNWGNSRVRSWAIENPVGIMSSQYRKPDQIINPWEYGQQASKKTCMWYRGLPLLVPTNIVGPPPRIADQTPEERKLWNACWYASPGKDRRKIRSRFFPGIAAAMAAQWGASPTVLREIPPSPRKLTLKPTRPRK